MCVAAPEGVVVGCEGDVGCWGDVAGEGVGEGQLREGDGAHVVHVFELEVYGVVGGVDEGKRRVGAQGPEDGAGAAGDVVNVADIVAVDQVVTEIVFVNGVDVAV